MYKNLTISSVLGALAVILGAFGAHALKNKLSVEALNSFEVGVRYQMYHAIALLCINMFTEISVKEKNKISRLFIIGILCFSGSIYMIQLLGVPAKYIWFITPIGGLFLIGGWGMLSYFFIKKHTEIKKR
ncbi:DUF423 domain-containing protein [Tenacibaculum maritimum]|uniref:DUF423 domain-containing protein n=1 Tax=Tenacibaculum maritimum TaxID=107401 RepID=UPI00042468BD|nr:DUF423 domain-containing protein [Tenacibaculum maritimum]MCD9611469.1 DUF423 domain-containing protein [Tenacibaculum maritimum]MDB0602528.1 DUF423 domain-containing protein [Tenacibaculum maritimum]MDB0613759.1 DUF423 domain-containing protein [Tenacibaculum maritimum]CAA0145921.1 conserved membrane hypothetical protein [Tenacibaculum maritimum]CAA0146072.1 conserved membrane hypothetical protein [Tenacibaculum maritimum]